MTCKNCGKFNWPYVGICKKCGVNLYAEFWKGRELRKGFVYGFLASSLFFLLKFLNSDTPVIIILVGAIAGSIAGIYFTIYMQRRIRGNTYLIKNRAFYLPEFIISILVSLYFLIFPSFFRDLYDSINDSIIILTITACWMIILIPMVWLIIYEIKNGRVIME